jgi:hypothetical protein
MEFLIKNADKVTLCNSMLGENKKNLEWNISTFEKESKTRVSHWIKI